MTDIRIHKIEARSFVDGPGERTVLFLQGCPIHCPGCQNIHLWDANRGRIEQVEEVAKTLATLAGRGGNITISGGEPFAQPRALSMLLRLLRDTYEIGHVIVYSGYTWEQLTNPQMSVDLHCSILAALSRIDILVDGQYIRNLNDPFISYRGSRNQRPIDVRASLESWGDPSIPPVILDWDSPEVEVAPDGSVFLPIGLVTDFAEIGEVRQAPQCGQTKGRPR